MSELERNEPSITEDRLLGGRIRLKQPAAGYRVAIDPVFLAASVPAEPHQLVLDVGCGSGAAMLCLAARVPHSRVVGLEMQRDLVRLAGDNVILNGLEAIDCRNASNFSFPGADAPPCKLQKPIRFRDLATLYPHVRKDPP